MEPGAVKLTWAYGPGGALRCCPNAE